MVSRSGALWAFAGMVCVVSRAGAAPPPPPGGYPYYNTSPGMVMASGALVDQSSQAFSVSSDVDVPSVPAGTLETSVYREGGTGQLDFVYQITPAASGEILQSLDVPWVNKEVQLVDAGYSGTSLAPVTIARYDDGDPVTFLFEYSLVPGDSNLDGGTASLVLRTDAEAYTWSDAFEARTIGDGNFEFSDGIGGFEPVEAPEPGSCGLVGLSAVPLLLRRNWESER